MESGETFFVSLDKEYEFDYALSLFNNKFGGEDIVKNTNL